METQPQLLLLQKTMVAAEGIAHVLDPEVNLWDVAAPLLEAWLKDNIGPDARLRDAAEGMADLARRIPVLMERTGRTAGRLAKGEIRLAPENTRSIAREIAAEQNRLGRVRPGAVLGRGRPRRSADHRDLVARRRYTHFLHELFVINGNVHANHGYPADRAQPGNPSVLANKRILLIIAGGIAAYKSLELIRRLKDRGARVRCILTKSGAEFVTPLSVASLSGEKCYTDLFSLTDESEMGHIRLSREADLVVVAPATADLMAKMAGGPRRRSRLDRRFSRPTSRCCSRPP